MKIDLIVDLQYGSTGKGLLAGFLAENIEHDAVATCNMPNAGHTYINAKGDVMIHKILPNGVVSPKIKHILIGPGSVFSPEKLFEEIDKALSLGYMENAKVCVHPNAVILLPLHVELEKETLSMISSTMQGSMAASIHKMGRDIVQSPLAKNNKGIIESHPRVSVATNDGWMEVVGSCNRILAEGSQGFSLGLNQRFWPYCTSRECTPYRLLSDMGLPQIKAHVWGTLRTYPIRVGNTADGYSGGGYLDQSETTWEALGQKPEKTTVTQRIRRVFTFSNAQMEEAMWHCRPDSLFLNFCNYMNPVNLGILTDNIERISAKYDANLALMGYGATYNDVKTFTKG